MEEQKKNGRGGFRPGAGRKRNDFPSKRHTVYCDPDELFLIKALLKEVRDEKKAWKPVYAAKSGSDEQYAAFEKAKDMTEKVNSTTIAVLKQKGMALHDQSLKKIEEKGKSLADEKLKK